MEGVQRVCGGCVCVEGGWRVHKVKVCGGCGVWGGCGEGMGRVCGGCVEGVEGVEGVWRVWRVCGGCGGCVEGVEGVQVKVCEQVNHYWSNHKSIKGDIHTTFPGLVPTQRMGTTVTPHTCALLGHLASSPAPLPLLLFLQLLFLFLLLFSSAHDSSSLLLLSLGLGGFVGGPRPLIHFHRLLQSGTLCSKTHCQLSLEIHYGSRWLHIKL